MQYVTYFNFFQIITILLQAKNQFVKWAFFLSQSPKIQLNFKLGLIGQKMKKMKYKIHLIMMSVKEKTRSGNVTRNQHPVMFS